MTLYDRYFLVVMVTIILIRVLVYLFPKASPTVKNFRIHHSDVWTTMYLYSF